MAQDAKSAQSAARAASRAAATAAAKAPAKPRARRAKSASAKPRGRVACGAEGCEKTFRAAGQGLAYHRSWAHKSAETAEAAAAG